MINSAHYSDFRVWCMKKNLFCDKPNELFAVTGECTLAKITLNAKEVVQSTINEIWTNKRDKIIDYRQVDA